MKKVIVILSALLILPQGSAIAARIERDSIERALDYGEGYNCSSLTANAKLKLTVQQTAQLRVLNEKYAQEIQPIREQLSITGHELKVEWLQTEPNRVRIEVIQGQTAKLQEHMHAKLAAYRADILKILTLEQRMHLPKDGHGRIFRKPTGFGQR